jgi:UDP-2,3-diacylglucosamine hydrolase
MAIYFASDFHLGLHSQPSSKEREKIICQWFDSISSDTEELFLLGDMFDFWYEYSQVVPKGNIRLLAKIAEFTDRSIPVHVFTGNHDMWMYGYLEEELGVKIYKHPLSIQLDKHRFHIGHGDGLGPGDHGYKIIKKIFSSSFNQWLFARLHPNTGIKLMKWFSKKSRESEEEVLEFKGAENEWLISYSEQMLQEEHYDFFIFGHRHLPIDYTLSNKKSRYINTGDWIHHYSYAKYSNGELELLKFDHVSTK